MSQSIDTQDLSSLEESATQFLSSPPTDLPSGDLGAAFLKMLVSLLAVVILLLLSYWILRKCIQTRLQKGGGNPAIQILEKRMMSPKTTLYLVEVEGKKTLVAESHLEIKRLESYPSSEREDTHTL